MVCARNKMAPIDLNTMIHNCSSAPCIYEVALNTATVPVFIQNQTHLLFANPAALAVMGAPEGVDLVGRSVNDFMHTDSIEASEERRRLALQQGASLRSIPIKGRTVDGTVRRAVTDGERIVDTGGHAAIVHVLREVDGRPLMTYRAPISDPVDADHTAPCLHEAAFESAAVPLVLHDGVTIMAANLQARRILGTDPRGTSPSSFTHEQSQEAARERRELALGKGQHLRGVHIKLNRIPSNDGEPTTISVTVDASPISHEGKRLLLLTTRDARR